MVKFIVGILVLFALMTLNRETDIHANVFISAAYIIGSLIEFVWRDKRNGGR